mmetsp:Transcript_4127/g.14463  ORF Transcript_4127/g.14463 Transcript_4127/m.14463 type:complete len:208 (+) Transcript_4127:3336-3959(+)
MSSPARGARPLRTERDAARAPEHDERRRRPPTRARSVREPSRPAASRVHRADGEGAVPPARGARMRHPRPPPLVQRLLRRDDGGGEGRGPGVPLRRRGGHDQRVRLAARSLRRRRAPLRRRRGRGGVLARAAVPEVSPRGRRGDARGEALPRGDGDDGGAADESDRVVQELGEASGDVRNVRPRQANAVHRPGTARGRLEDGNASMC